MAYKRRPNIFIGRPELDEALVCSFFPFHLSVILSSSLYQVLPPLYVPLLSLPSNRLLSYGQLDMDEEPHRSHSSTP
jgi:hypothetical protein